MFFDQTSWENLAEIINFPWTNHIWRKICFACICLMGRNEKKSTNMNSFSGTRKSIFHEILRVSYIVTAKSYRKKLSNRGICAQVSQTSKCECLIVTRIFLLIVFFGQNSLHNFNYSTEIMSTRLDNFFTSFRFKIRRLTELTRRKFLNWTSGENLGQGKSE